MPCLNNVHQYKLRDSCTTLIHHYAHTMYTYNAHAQTIRSVATTIFNIGTLDYTSLQNIFNDLHHHGAHIFVC